MILYIIFREDDYVVNITNYITLFEAAFQDGFQMSSATEFEN